MYMKDQVEPTPTEKKFVHEYVQDFNGAQAYMRATGGTNAKSASVQASKFLKKPRVKTYLEAYTKELLGPKEKTLLGNIDFWVGVRDDPQASA
jgi:phage terminase small subunit